jgi:hypothetical protein
MVKIKPESDENEPEDEESNRNMVKTKPESDETNRKMKKIFLKKERNKEK